MSWLTRFISDPNRRPCKAMGFHRCDLLKVLAAVTRALDGLADHQLVELAVPKELPGLKSTSCALTIVKRHI